ncbi:MAG: hypothetical protein V7K98_11295 [Nostoc sp.]|uniref:hypothetical protein n=1 Tax=Nostoc sp. TaxID=1180 RepID=UPI002FFC99BF
MSDAFGGLRLRTLEILQAIALFNEPQRRRGHRGRREAMSSAGFAYAQWRFEARSPFLPIFISANVL